MKAQIMVWGWYDAQSRTPLLGEKEIDVASYADGHKETEDYCSELGGKKAHIEFDGPNHNYNSYWFSR